MSFMNEASYHHVPIQRQSHAGPICNLLFLRETTAQWDHHIAAVSCHHIPRITIFFFDTTTFQKET